jgi:hypothetical protein
VRADKEYIPLQRRATMKSAPNAAASYRIELPAEEIRV